MKTLQEIEQFYRTKLLPDLYVLEAKRKKVMRNLICISSVMLAVVAAFIFLWARYFQMGSPFIFALVAFGVIAGLYICASGRKDYVQEFKILVIDQIVRFIDENLTYRRQGCIPMSVFMFSQIFKTKPNIYEGDDLVCGKIGATRIEFSEIRAKYESGSGKNRQVKTIFRGLFFVADFNKKLVGRTVVLPDTAERLFGHLGKLMQSWNVARDQLIKLEDPEFERFFVVYGMDQIQARYILSTSLMRRIVDFKKTTNRQIYLSFVGSNVFVAISYGRKLFEPRLFRTIVDFELVREYFEDLQLAISIVDDLNLNTRIWSKE